MVADPNYGMALPPMQATLAAALPPGVLHQEAALQRFEEAEDGVTLHFHGGRRQPVTARLLIGADGAQSGVREQLLGDGPPTFLGVQAVGQPGCLKAMQAERMGAQLHCWPDAEAAAVAFKCPIFYTLPALPQALPSGGVSLPSPPGGPAQALTASGCSSRASCAPSPFRVPGRLCGRWAGAMLQRGQGVQGASCYGS